MAPFLRKPARRFRSTGLLFLVGVLWMLAGAYQFWHIRQPQPLTLPPPRQVVTANPKIGVHTRLTGTGDEAAIARSFAQVREMGAPWVVELFPWAYAQPRSRYGYDWNGFDMIVAHARQQGLTVVARLDIVPAWARPNGSSDRLLLPERYDDYARYVAAFLTRYRPQGVRHIIIWNEPNLAFEWGQRPPDPAAYAALLKAVYPRARAAAPDAVIIAGGLSPQPDAGTGPERMNDLLYLDGVYAAGGSAFFDMWAVHTYGAHQPHDAPPAPGVANFRRVELMRDALVKHGDASKQIIITEGGWNDSPRWSAAVAPADRIRWTVGAYRLAQEWDWLEAMCMWQFSLPTPTRTYQDYWTFVAPDGTPKAIYYAVQALSQPPPP